MQPIMQWFLSVKPIVIEKIVHPNTMAEVFVALVVSPVKILLCNMAVECDFSYFRKDNRTVVIPSVVWTTITFLVSELKNTQKKPRV
jgi:hypothetical protein